jgi:hypothetical protein
MAMAADAELPDRIGHSPRELRLWACLYTATGRTCPRLTNSLERELAPAFPEPVLVMFTTIPPQIQWVKLRAVTVGWRDTYSERACELDLFHLVR